MSNDAPDIPQEVLARQAQSRPLDAVTAQLIGQKEYIDDSGRFAGTARTVDESAKKARKAAEEFMGETPLAGMTEVQIAAIKAKHYPDGPKMGFAGDRDQKFVDWLWNTYPKDAVKRYAYRDVWPTKFAVRHKIEPVEMVAIKSRKQPLDLDDHQPKISIVPVKVRRKRGPNKPKAAPATPATV